MRKRAETSILAVFISLAIACLFLPLFEYIRMTENVKTVQKTMETAMENNMVVFSVEQYDFIKGNGDGKPVLPDETKNQQKAEMLLADMGYIQNGEEWTQENNRKISITNVKLKCVMNENGVRYKLVYDIIAKYSVMGVHIRSVTYPRKTMAQLYRIV